MLPLTSNEAVLGFFLNLGDFICKTGIIEVLDTFYKTLGAKNVQEFALFQVSRLCSTIQNMTFQ